MVTECKVKNNKNSCKTICLTLPTPYIINYNSMIYTMKRNTLLYGLLMCASSIMAQSGQKFIIKGSLQGLPDSLKVKLIDTENDEQNKTIAESDISNGCFILEGSVPNTRLCELIFTRKGKQSGYDISTIRVRIPVENAPITISSMCLMTVSSKLTIRKNRKCF